MKIRLIVLLFVLLASNVYSYDIFYGDYTQELFPEYIDIPVVAANPKENMGILGRVRIARGIGSNKIVFDSRTEVDYSTVNSVIHAIDYANVSGYDYFISYDLGTSEVKGGSTGAAVAMGLLAMKESKSYDSGVIVTGDLEKGKLAQSGGIGLKILPLPGKTLVAVGDEYVYISSGGSIIAKKTEKFAFENNVNLLRIEDLSVIKDKCLKQKL